MTAGLTDISLGNWILLKTTPFMYVCAECSYDLENISVNENNKVWKIVNHNYKHKKTKTINKQIIPKKPSAWRELVGLCGKLVSLTLSVSDSTHFPSLNIDSILSLLNRGSEIIKKKVLKSENKCMNIISNSLGCLNICYVEETI